MKVRVFPAVGSLPRADEERWQPVVIDVLRATTVIIAALAAGARAVEPWSTPQEVEAAWERRRGERPAPLRTGERGGVRIPGFDLGNSPLEYTSGTVGGRTICFTTSNGTQALVEAAVHGDVLCAAFTNRRAVARALAHRGDNVFILCAGTDRAFSADDLGVAGALIRSLRDEVPVEADDLGTVAEHWYMGHRSGLLPMLRGTRHGRHLVDLGMAQDLECCATLDCHDVVPVLRDGLITPLEMARHEP